MIDYKDIASILQWVITILAGGLSTWAIKNNMYWRTRNIEFENRVTKIESAVVDEARIQQMIDISQKQLIEVVNNLKKGQEKSDQTVEKLMVLVSDLTIVTKVLQNTVGTHD